MKTALENAFIRMDEDLSKEALTPVNGQINMKTLSVAMSGTVACVAHIDGPHLHVAHVGDCCAVLGKLTLIYVYVYKNLSLKALQPKQIRGLHEN